MEFSTLVILICPLYGLPFCKCLVFRLMFCPALLLRTWDHPRFEGRACDMVAFEPFVGVAIKLNPVRSRDHKMQLVGWKGGTFKMALDMQANYTCNIICTIPFFRVPGSFRHNDERYLHVYLNNAVRSSDLGRP